MHLHSNLTVCTEQVFVFLAGTDPEKVKQFRAEKEDYNRKIKTIREERAQMREELEKLQAEQLKKE